MRISTGTIVVGVFVAMGSLAGGQPPERPADGSKENRSGTDATSFIARMLTFDANHDGQLAKDEITDTRILALFNRADANNDGIVTKEELTTLFGKESASLGRGFDGGSGGPGGPGRRGIGGPGGRGGPGPGGPPPIGEVLPPHVKGMLQLSNAQRKKIDALQKMVDTRLDQILTEEQKQQLKELRDHGPGGPEGGRGPGGDRFGAPPGGDGNQGRGGGQGGTGGDRGNPPAENEHPQRPPE